VPAAVLISLLLAPTRWKEHFKVKLCNTLWVMQVLVARSVGENTVF
jgi:hypothetical protein